MLLNNGRNNPVAFKRNGSLSAFNGEQVKRKFVQCNLTDTEFIIAGDEVIE